MPAYVPVSSAHVQVASVVRMLRDAMIRGKELPPETLLKVRNYLRLHRIEMVSMPSPAPGEERAGAGGCSPAQMNVVKAFRYGRHMPIPDDPDDLVARKLRQSGRRRYNRINAGGANRSGKTVSIWGMCFCQHLRDHAQDGDLYWAIAPNFVKLKQGPHKWLNEYLPPTMFKGRTYSESLGFGTNPIMELALPNGRGIATIVFKTEEQTMETFESDSVNGIAWTEATRESIYDAIISRVVDTGGFILVDYLRDEAWHGDRFESNPNAFYQHFRMMDNAHNLPPGAIQDAIADMTADEAAVRIYGKNRAAYGAVIKEFRPERFRRGDADSGHLVRPFKIPANWPLWVFTDVGKYTASLLLSVGHDARCYVVDEAYTVGEMYDVHIREIDAMLMRNGLTRQRVQGGRDGGPAWAMDPAAWNFSATNEKNLGQLYIDNGLNYKPWIRTATIGERAMLEYMRSQFTQFGVLVFDRCRNTIEELMTWKHKLDRNGKIDPRESYTGNNHAIDALKAWMNSDPRFGRAADAVDLFRPANQISGVNLWDDFQDGQPFDASDDQALR